MYGYFIDLHQYTIYRKNYNETTLIGFLLMCVFMCGAPPHFFLSYNIAIIRLKYKIKYYLLYLSNKFFCFQTITDLIKTSKYLSIFIYNVLAIITLKKAILKKKTIDIFYDKNLNN